MRLTTFSDYALRVLMYTQSAGDRLVTIDEMTRAYGVSRAHLMKVVNALTRAGYLTSVRGRAGGVRLALSPDKIRLGDVVRATEPDFSLVECFTTGNQCVITSYCRLPRILNKALASFMDVLDQYTLAGLAADVKKTGKKTGKAGL